MSHSDLISMSPMIWESLWTREIGRRTAAGPGADELFAVYGPDADEEREAERSAVVGGR